MTRLPSTLACLLVGSAGAFAQDSVSKFGALPGDALSRHTTSEQVNDYVVDQTVLTTSWGTVFAIAPIVKSSASRDTAPVFFGSLFGPQAISQDLQSGVPFARPSYSLWTTAGQGVNGNINANDPPASSVNTVAATGHQLAVGFTDASTGTLNPGGNDAGLAANIVGVVNYTDERPSRLHVSRINAAVNGAGEGCNVASFGYGGVDSDGNTALRADGFGGSDCSGLTTLTGDNWFRVDALARNSGVLNTISNAGASDAAASQRLINNSATVHSPPSLIPETSPSGRPIVVGINFNSEYVFESAVGVTSTTVAHLAAPVSSTRGAITYAPHNFPGLLGGGNTHGVGAALGVASSTNSLLVWGLGANGATTGAVARALPAGINDPCALGGAWTPTAIAGTQRFDHYTSQVAFQGGSGQAAVGRDKSGNLLAAGVVYYGTPNPDGQADGQNPNNYIAVARIDPTTGATDWTIAGWTEYRMAAPALDDGKDVTDGNGGVVGRLSGAITGPSLSGVAFDSVGNLYFLGFVDDGVNTTAALLRGVYDEASFCYELELVLRQGDVFAGQNSDRDYQIDFLTITDNNSVSSGTLWSSNVTKAAWRGLDPTTLDQADSRTLGGLVLGVDVVYDANDDGVFDSPTAAGMATGDEDYNVLLFLQGGADCNDNGVLDDRDIADGTSTDGNGNGIPDECDAVVPGVTQYCFASTTTCPCGAGVQNGTDGLGGCDHSFLTGGARLEIGTTDGLQPSVSSDNGGGQVTATTTRGIPNGSSHLIFQGTSQILSPFGDGLRCVGGSVIRCGVRPFGSVGGFPAGELTYAPGTFGPANNLPLATQGQIPAGGATRTYQGWYRNAAPFCTSGTFNLTNAVEVVWIP